MAGSAPLTTTPADQLVDGVKRQGTLGDAVSQPQDLLVCPESFDAPLSAPMGFIRDHHATMPGVTPRTEPTLSPKERAQLAQSCTAPSTRLNKTPIPCESRNGFSNLGPPFQDHASKLGFQEFELPYQAISSVQTAILRTSQDPQQWPARSVPAAPGPLSTLSWHNFTGTGPAGSLFTIVIPVVFDAVPWFYVPPEGCLGARISARDRGHATAQSSAKNVARLTFSTHLEIMLATRLCAANDGTILVFALPLPTRIGNAANWKQLCDTPQLCQPWCSGSSLALLSVMPPSAMQLCPIGSIPTMASSRLSWWRAQSELLASVSESGASRQARKARPMRAPTGCAANWLSSKQTLIATSNDLLRSELIREADDHTGAVRDSILGWADSVLPVPWAELPSQLLPELDQFLDPSLLLLPFPEPCPVAHTTWLPLSVQPQLPSGFNPTSISDLLLPHALTMIRAWVEQQLLFLREVQLLGSAATRRSNSPLALGQNCFVPRARGIVWDLRNLANGIVVALDFSTPIKSHLNLELFKSELVGYPDQELMSFLLEGSRYKTDLELQIVLLPHLISLKEGYSSLLAEVNKYEAVGWYGLFDHPPFLPFRCVPKGSVPRKLEPDRPRPTTDAGAPRGALIDTEGCPVRSTNHAALGRPPEQLADVTRLSSKTESSGKWPHENKPTVGNVLTALVILNAVGRIVKEPVLVATDDFKNFFNQLLTAPEEWWKNCMIISDEIGAKYATEYIVTFGVSPASNIAQRFGESVMFLFRKRFEEADSEFLEADMQRHPELREWHTARQSLGEPSYQSQLAFSCIYTDDPLFAVVGAARMARALRVWTVLTSELKLMMATALKRQAGSHVLWVGAGILAPLALGWVPIHKTLSALSRLDQVIRKPRPSILLGEYHSLLGLLEHLVFLNGMRRDIMYGMWHPFKQGYMPEPNVLLKATALMVKQAQRWMKLLNDSAAVSGLRLVYQQPMAITPPNYTLSSDAAQDPGFAGLGGWCHGLWWGFALPNELVALNIHITVLELIASIVSICTFPSEVPALLEASTCVSLHARSDAAATVSTLAQDSAKSEMMQHVHNLALSEPAFSMHLPHLLFSHIYGIANELADAASRSDHARLIALATQLRITPRRVQPAPILQKLLSLVASLYRDKLALAFENSIALVVANAPTSASFVQVIASADALVAFGLRSAPSVKKARRSKFKHGGLCPRDEETFTAGPHRSVKIRAERAFTAGHQRSVKVRTSEITFRKVVDESQELDFPVSTISSGSIQRSQDWTTNDCQLSESGSLKSKFTKAGLTSTRTLARLTSRDHQQPVLFSPVVCASSQSRVRGRRHAHFTPTQPVISAERAELFSLAMEGRNQGTVANETGHWRKYWLPFCTARGIHPLRDDREANSGSDHAGYVEEVEILAAFLVEVLKIMKPQRGRPAALPNSGAGVVRSIRRVHANQVPPVHMVPFAAVLPVLKGISRRYKKQHTYRHLLPKRKEPWRLPWLAKMCDLRKDKELRLGGFGWDDPLLMTSYHALLETLAQTGFRRSEIAVRHKGLFDPSSHLTRSSLLWSIGGTIYADPSAKILASATESDYALLLPPCSKTDAFGVIWGDKPIPLPFRFKAPYCAALRLRELELLHPLHGPDRAASPLFVMAPGLPFTYHHLNKMLDDVKRMVLPGTVDSSLFTYHSFRITLATQLGAVTSMKINNLDIQAMCRWQSEASLDIYKRLQAPRHIQMLDAAMAARISSYQTSSLPMLDSAELLGVLETTCSLE